MEIIITRIHIPHRMRNLRDSASSAECELFRYSYHPIIAFLDPTPSPRYTHSYMTLRLGVNIDHVATLRNARGGAHPHVLRAAEMSKEAGADGLTIHLREDRRHIRDADVAELKAWGGLPINLEMAPTPEMLAIALATRPNACCLVPEKRAELTTEGGLDVAGNLAALKDYTAQLNAAGIRVSLFIAPDSAQVQASADCGADIVELHTGAYAEHLLTLSHWEREAVLSAAGEGELARLRVAATLAHALGLECHAGHGLTYDNVAAIAAIPEIVELNIGHFIIGEAVFVGLNAAIRQMRECMSRA